VQLLDHCPVARYSLPLAMVTCLDDGRLVTLRVTLDERHSVSSVTVPRRPRGHWRARGCIGRARGRRLRVRAATSGQTVAVTGELLLMMMMMMMMLVTQQVAVAVAAMVVCRLTSSQLCHQ